MPETADNVNLVALDNLSDEELVYVFHYSYNGKLFAVLASTDPPRDAKPKGPSRRAGLPNWTS
jgi:hypothetical protein